MGSQRQPTERDRDERVTLAGPDPEDVLRALLRVDPESEPAERRDDRQDEHPDKG